MERRKNVPITLKGSRIIYVCKSKQDKKKKLVRFYKRTGEAVDVWW